MSEGQSFEVEGKRNRFSRIKDALGSKSWAKEVASQFDSTVEQIGDTTESLGLKPVFLDETAKKELFEHWQQNGGSEVGGYAIGTESEYDSHKYLHVTKIIPDLGSGSLGEFQFAGPHVAYEYVRQKRQAGEHLVLIGTVHTHPKGWSGRITGQGRDSTMFSTWENINGELLSSKRSHIVMTPADDNKVDIWQAKETSDEWQKRLARSGYFLLKSNKPPHKMVRVLEQPSPNRVKAVDKPSRVRVID